MAFSLGVGGLGRVTVQLITLYQENHALCSKSKVSDSNGAMCPDHPME